MTSRKLNFDEETKQFIAIYTNIKGEEIEKIFTRQPADKTFKEIVKYWKDVDQLSIRERMTDGPVPHGFGPKRHKGRNTWKEQKRGICKC